MSNENGKTMTEGEWRVGVSFNPSKDLRVDEVKRVTAGLIDSILLNGADKRTAALAATAFEDAAMWAVKSLTKQPRVPVQYRELCALIGEIVRMI